MDDHSRYILAIDLGTGGPKVALADTDGGVVGHEVEPNRLFLGDGGAAEQDPEEWWSSIVTAARRLMSRSLVSADSVIAVSVTAQWMGTVAVDATGAHLHNALIWMDARGAPHARALAGGPLRVAGYDPRKIRKWLRYTAGAPSLTGKDSLGHILWFKNELPEVYEATDTFLEPMDYLNMRLTGRKAASFDTIAGTWVADIRDLAKVTYVPELLDLAGIDGQKLPELVPTGSVLATIQPHVAEQLGISPAAQVITGTPDTNSAAVGSGAVEDRVAHLYVGTSSWLSCHVEAKKTDVLHTITTLPSGIPGRYLVACEQDVAGACLTHLIDNVLYPDDHLSVVDAPEDVLERLNETAAGVPPGAGGVIYTPWLNGERTPVDDHTTRGGFFNLSLTSNRAHLVRAVFEGVAYNTRWMHAYVEKFAGCRFEAVTFVGGGAQSDLWCQVMADVLDRPVRQACEPRLANARGAAIMASAALGHLDWEEVPGRVEVQQTFFPEPAHREVYDRHYRSFLALYKKNKGVYAKLNR